jgi:hypothetical protein
MHIGDVCTDKGETGGGGREGQGVAGNAYSYLHICTFIVYICLSEFRASVTGSIEFFINSCVKVSGATIMNALTKLPSVFFVL